VGYYVNNEYSDPELKENPPQEPDFNKVLLNFIGLFYFEAVNIF